MEQVNVASVSRRAKRVFAASLSRGSGMGGASARFGISAAVVGVVARKLAELGAGSASFADVGESNYVDGKTADAILDDAATRLGDEAIGVTLAMNLAPGALGLLDYALITAETWGAALRRVAQFYGTLSERVTMSIEEQGEEAAIVHTRHPLHCRNRHWIEFSFAIMAERARHALGADFDLIAVEFRHGPPERDANHARCFAAPVRFDQPTDRLVFARRWLHAPLSTGSPVLADAIQRRLEELVPSALDPMMLRLREAIAHGIDKSDVTLETIASRLGQSPRSLQRTLRERGTSYKDQVDAIRRDRALALLHANELTVAEVGRRLGFAESTAFFRAFRRWTGTTPGSQRQGSTDDGPEPS